MFSLEKCANQCSPNAFCYNPGIIGANYNNSRIMFVLHRSDARVLETEKPVDTGLMLFNANELPSEDYYKQALRKSDTGRLLRWMNGYCGINEDDVYITNLFKCLLPDDKNPREKEYRWTQPWRNQG